MTCHFYKVFHAFETRICIRNFNVKWAKHETLTQRWFKVSLMLNVSKLENLRLEGWEMTTFYCCWPIFICISIGHANTMRDPALAQCCAKLAQHWASAGSRSFLKGLLVTWMYDLWPLINWGTNGRTMSSEHPISKPVSFHSISPEWEVRRCGID